MDIEHFKVRMSSDELSGIIVAQSGGVVESCVCKNGRIRICGKHPDDDKYWAEISVRVDAGALMLEVVDASVDGVWLGFQEWGVSMQLDKLMQRVFHRAKSGGRATTVVPFTDVATMLAKVCKVPVLNLAEPTILLSDEGLELSC